MEEFLAICRGSRFHIYDSDINTITKIMKFKNLISIISHYNGCFELHLDSGYEYLNPQLKFYRLNQILEFLEIYHKYNITMSNGNLMTNERDYSIYGLSHDGKIKIINRSSVWELAKEIVNYPEFDFERHWPQQNDIKIALKN